MDFLYARAKYLYSNHIVKDISIIASLCTLIDYKLGCILCFATSRLQNSAFFIIFALQKNKKNGKFAEHS